MKKFLLIIILLGFILSPSSVFALSESCNPAVSCDKEKDYYTQSGRSDCFKHISAVLGSIETSCSVSNPEGQTWSFSCSL
ncbi:MAG: hypothetical protein V1908_01590, partial [Candidatus Peregrinibacteria bacterium]